MRGRKGGVFQPDLTPKKEEKEERSGRVSPFIDHARVGKSSVSCSGEEDEEEEEASK